MCELFKIKNLFSVMFIFGSLSLSAQEQEVSDTELGQFADAYINLLVQNQEAQNEMMEIIENEGLKVERFNEIQQASIDPSKTSNADVDEIEKHAKATAKIEDLQPKLEKNAIQGIKATGMTIERYQTLAAVIQEKKNLQQRLQTLIVKRQEP